MNQDSTGQVSRQLNKAVYVGARSQHGRQKMAGLVEVQVQVGIFLSLTCDNGSSHVLTVDLQGKKSTLNRTQQTALWKM